MRPHHQLHIPPMEVEPLYRSVGQTVKPAARTVKSVNLLKITRQALEKSHLKHRWLASLFGCSEQLISAQLSDHAEDKHLSMRKMGRIEELGFWREFLHLLAEDLGYDVLVVTPDQKQAIRDLLAASANLQRVNAL